jgi:uncharacterized membrane protein required for colicin V production
MLALVALLAWRGSRRGLIGELAGLAAFAIALECAFRLDGRLGHRLHGAAPGLTTTEARILAFFAILLVASLGVGLAAGLLTRMIRRVPLAGGVNRLGGLLAGAALAVLAIWLITVCLLLLPATLLPFSASVHHSEAARLLRSMPPQWSHGLRAHLDQVGAVHLSH